MLVSTAAGGGIQIPKRTDEFQPKENNYTQKTSKRRMDVDLNHSQEIDQSQSSNNFSAARKEEGQRNDRQMIQRSRINIDQINQVQEIVDDDETVNFDAFVATNLEAEDQETLDPVRQKRGRGEQIVARAAGAHDSKSPSPRSYFQNRNNEQVVQNQITANIEKPHRPQRAVVQVQNAIQIQGQGGGQAHPHAHAPSLAGPTLGISALQHQQKELNQVQQLQPPRGLSKRTNMQNQNLQSNPKHHRYSSQPPTITASPQLPASGAKNYLNDSIMKQQFGVTNPTVGSTRMPQMGDYQASQRDDYFDHERNSAGAKTRDIFGSLGAAEHGNHASLVGNPEGRLPGTNEGLNLNEQSLISAIDEQKGQQIGPNNRISLEAHQKGGGLTMNDVQSKYANNQMLHQSQQNPLRNAHPQHSSNYGSASLNKNKPGQVVSSQLPSRRTALYNSVEGHDAIARSKPQPQIQPHLTRASGGPIKKMNPNNRGNALPGHTTMHQNQQMNFINQSINNGPHGNLAKNIGRPDVENPSNNNLNTRDHVVHLTQRRERNTNSRLNRINNNALDHPQPAASNSKAHQHNIAYSQQHHQFRKVAQQLNHLQQYGGANSAADRYQTQGVTGPVVHHAQNNTQMNFYKKLIAQPNHAQNQGNLPNMAALRTGSSGASGASGASGISGLSLISNPTGGIPLQVANNGGVLTTGAKRRKERSLGLYPDLAPQVIHFVQNPGVDPQLQGSIPNIQQVARIAQPQNFNDSYVDSNSQEGFYRRFQRNHRQQHPMHSGGDAGFSGQSAASRASGSAVSGLSGGSGASDGLQHFGVSLPNHNIGGKVNKNHLNPNGFSRLDNSFDGTGRSIRGAAKMSANYQAHQANQELSLGGMVMTNDDYALLNQNPNSTGPVHINTNGNVVLIHQLNNNQNPNIQNQRKANVQVLHSSKNTVRNSVNIRREIKEQQPVMHCSPQLSSKAKQQQIIQNYQKKRGNKQQRSHLMQSQKLDQIHQLIVSRQQERNNNLAAIQQAAIVQSLPPAPLQANQIDIKAAASTRVQSIQQNK